MTVLQKSTPKRIRAPTAICITKICNRNGGIKAAAFSSTNFEMKAPGLKSGEDSNSVFWQIEKINRGRRFSKLRKLSQNECVFLSGCSTLGSIGGVSRLGEIGADGLIRGGVVYWARRREPWEYAQPGG
jgi:hypothetical protein